MRRPLEEVEEAMAELQRNKRAETSGRYFTEQGGGFKGNTDQAEGWRRNHLRDGRTGLLEGGETAEVEGRQARVRNNWRRQGGE